MDKSIRILIADDHNLVRQGFEALLSVKEGIEVVGLAENGEKAIKMARSLSPDIILMDLMMPVKNGIEATREIKKEYPDARILIITSFAEDDNVFQAVKAGALGYLLKDSSPGELMQAIEDVCKGRMSLHPSIANKLMDELNKPLEGKVTEDPLTERELEVLKLVAKGISNQDIADKLVVSERTVGAHVSNILAKLHLANRTQAALYALRKGFTDLTPEEE
jgi:NarL family two-component system response regulator LiaR